MFVWPGTAYALILGYLLGSIPFGLIFAKMSGAGDIRQVGSGATGATNVLRTGKYGAAAATLLFDAAKGVAAVLIAWQFWGATAGAVAAVGAILGHLFPVWLGFKGGKGVATSLGVLLTLHWPVALLALATWLVVALITRISSLSALAAALAAPVYMFVWGQMTFAAATLIIALLVLFAHRENIKRLLAGTEPRIGKSK